MIAAVPQNHREIESLVSKLQYKYHKELHADMSEARILAAEDVAKQLIPDMTGQELEQWLGRQRALAKARLKASNSFDSPTPTPTQAKQGGKESVSIKYREWIKENDFVPFDPLLAHFNGHVRQAFGHVRRQMQKEGYVFTRVEHGWAISTRPTPAEPEPQLEPEPVLTSDEFVQLKQLLAKLGLSL